MLVEASAKKVVEAMWRLVWGRWGASVWKVGSGLVVCF